MSRSTSLLCAKTKVGIKIWCWMDQKQIELNSKSPTWQELEVISCPVMTMLRAITQLVEPLVSLVGSHKMRCVYKTIESTNRGCCGDCNKDLINKACLFSIRAPNHVSRALFRSCP